MMQMTSPSPSPGAIGPKMAPSTVCTVVDSSLIDLQQQSTTTFGIRCGFLHGKRHWHLSYRSEGPIQRQETRQTTQRRSKLAQASYKASAGTLQIPADPLQIPADPLQIPAGAGEIPAGARQIPAGPRQIPLKHARRAQARQRAGGRVLPRPGHARRRTWDKCRRGGGASRGSAHT